MDWRQINERFVNPAVAAWQAGKTQEAETVFKEGLVATANDGYVALNYAHFLEHCGRLKEAEEMFAVALKKLPLPEFKQRAEVGLERITRGFGTPTPHIKVIGAQPQLDSRKRYPAEYRTADGRWVRSKSEKIIADWLYNNHIRFEYERKIAEGVTCDFYLPDMDAYIEFWGLDNEVYRRYRRRKEEVYSKLGIRLLSLDEADLKHIDDVLRSRLTELAGPSSIGPSVDSVQRVDTSFSRTAVTLGRKWLNPNDPNVISCFDPGKYIGQIKTVEGKVVRTHKAAKNTIFLNFYPPTKQSSVPRLFAVIFGRDLNGFPFAPEVFYRGKEVRITGRIDRYGTDKRIVVRVPSQVEIAFAGYSYASQSTK